MKTAATVLQEMMVHLGETIEYEFGPQIGPQHMATFEVQCKALGHVARAQARSKKEAKQEVARLMLIELAKSGQQVPPPYGLNIATPIEASKRSVVDAVEAARTYVMLLKELAEEYKLPAPEYELVDDTGPPHKRHFTITARVARHERTATSTSKKAARQLAAEQLYKYLRENVKATKDFVEDEALSRAHDKVMERYVASKGEQLWRPDLAQKLEDYHLDAEKVKLASEKLADVGSVSNEQALASTVDALGLRLKYDTLPTKNSPLVIVKISGCQPELVLGGNSANEASAQALQYLSLALNAGQ